MAIHSWKVSTTILSLVAGAVSGFSVPKKNDYSARMIRPSKNFGSAARRRVSSLSVMSINFLNNDPGNQNDEDSDEGKEVDRLSLSTMDEEDFSFLKQWPLMPGDTLPGGSDGDETNLAARSKETIESSRYRGTNPLANLVQLVEMVAPLDGSPKNESAKSNNIFNLADGLFRNVMDNAGGIFPSANETTTVQDLIAQEQWLDDLQLTLFDEAENATTPSSSTSSSRLSATQASALAAAATSNSSSTRALDGLFQEATSRVEYLVQEASNLASPSVIPELMDQTRQLFAFLKSKETDETVNNPLLEVTEPEQLKETTTYAATFMAVANAIFAAGYVQDEAGAPAAPLRASSGIEEETAKPLLADFLSAERIMPNDYPSVVMQGAEMGTLAGAIYEDTTRRTLALGHAIVARGTTANVAWMVTDSVVDGKMTRTLTIRGFDASDESVDREALLNVICTPEPVRLVDDKDILFHRGLLETAQAIYSDVSQYFEWTTAKQKIILNGHSIGGSLSILLLLLMTEDRGVDYVNKKVARVFAHGNPPMATVLKRPRGMRDYLDCPVLKSFNLPSGIVFGYIQPYDPIVRFMTQYDPLYPLVDDLGSDETTLYATGPRRSLRPLTRALFSSWDGWPEFRENWKSTNQSFQTVGMQHLLLPDPQRYLTDRFVSPNVGVPPTDQMVRISSTELLEALDQIFPLDTYQISLIPQAVRSFLHHFYPAYDASISNYASKVTKERRTLENKRATANMKVEASSAFLP